ncbi:hypothetical protein, partial [Priestia megaterium]|uniref:hypothetical protein n=1 Tax=Priestia megaterium TaxID=1404 RepID=UPI001F48DAC2
TSYPSSKQSFNPPNTYISPSQTTPKNTSYPPTNSSFSPNKSFPTKTATPKKPFLSSTFYSKQNPTSKTKNNSSQKPF